MARLTTPLLTLCVLLSGFSGLVYEVCWIRQAALGFGATTPALGTVLAVFFAGLATGSHAFGAIAKRTTRPLRLYGLLELGIAATALSSPWTASLAEDAFGVLFRATANEGLRNLGRAALVGLILLPPTFLMGGTLPLVCRQLVANEAGILTSVSFVYGVNTLGAAAGAAAGGFWLLPWLGTDGSVRLAAAANVLAGTLALALPIVAPVLTAPPARQPTVPPRRIAWLLAGCGFAALAQQVLWARFLAAIVRNTVHSYTLTLTVVLVGIVLGSLLASRWRRAPLELGFGACLAFAAVWTAVVMHLPVRTWSALHSDLAMLALLVLPPCVASGAALPLGIRLGINDPADTGPGVGRLTAANTLGCIAGAGCASLLLLPVAGLQTGVLLIALLGAGLAAYAWLGLGPSSRPRALAAAVPLVIVVVAYGLGPRLPHALLAPPDRLVAVCEGDGANLTVQREDGVLRLHIDRWWQGEDRKTHQIVAAHLPMLLHGKARHALVVGLGTGQAPSRFLMYPSLARLDVVDIEPALFDFVREHFDSAWMQDARVHLVRDDGRSLLLHGEQRYDVISLEIGQLFRPGAASFYTADFYARARQHLTPGGLLSQFVPLAFLELHDLQRLLATFQATFPHCMLWYNTSELLLIGAPDAELRLDPQRLSSLTEAGPVRDDLRYSLWGGAAESLDQPERFLAGFLCGSDSIGTLAAGAPLLRDAVPSLEYSAADVAETEQRELVLAQHLAEHLTPFDALWSGPALPATTAELRQRNLHALEARAHLRASRLAETRGNPAEAEAWLQRAERANADDLAVRRTRAERHHQAKATSQAEAAYRGILDRDPQDALAHRGLGLLLLEGSRLAQAEVELRAALALRPNDAASHAYLGAALARQGQAAAGVKHAERAVELRPGWTLGLEILTKLRAAH